MAFGGLNGGGHGSSLQSEINMVPLIDVMLVLLVIFMITAPMLSHSIVIDLPQVSSQPVKEDPVVVDLAVDGDGGIFWNEQPIGIAEIPERMRELAMQKPQPELRLRADRDTRYEVLADIMGNANRAGVKGIGFVTTPGSKPAAAEDTAAPGAGAPGAGAPGAAAPAG